MFAVYYWDSSDASNDQLYYTLPGNNQAYSAFNNMAIRNARLDLPSLYAVSLSTVFQCLPIFLRTTKGAAIVTIYNGRLQLLAENTPGVLNAPIVTGYTMIIPKLDEPRGKGYLAPQSNIPECVPNLERRISLIRSLQLPIETILSPEIAKVSKVKMGLSDYNIIKNIIQNGRLLTYVNLSRIPNNQNSIFLFVNDAGENYLSVVYYDPATNQIFPPQ